MPSAHPHHSQNQSSDTDSVDNASLDNHSSDSHSSHSHSSHHHNTEQKQPSFIRTHFQRGKKMSSVVKTLVGGFAKAQSIGAFKEPPRDKLPRYIQIFCRKMVNSFGMDVVQIQPVPQNHGLWVSNHISWMDIPVVGSVSPVFFLSKAEIANWPVIGALATAAGTLFIKRGSGDVGSISEQIATFLRAGSSVVFFPEATTTRGHKMKRIHGRLLTAAMETGLPIQPIVICYANEDGTISEEIGYYDDISMKDSLKQILDSKKITAYVLPLEPIIAEGQTQKELTALLQQRMQQGLTQLQKQVLCVKPADADWDEKTITKDIK